MNIAVIDFKRLAQDVLEKSIKDADVQKLLPLQTKLMRGTLYVHVINASAYTVEIGSNLVPDGIPFCGRKMLLLRSLPDFDVTGDGTVIRFKQHQVATCPDCLVKSKTVIVEYLIQQEEI